MVRNVSESVGVVQNSQNPIQKGLNFLASVLTIVGHSSVIAKRIQDRSISSSKFPKQYNSLFDYSCIFQKLRNCNCFDSFANQNKNNFMLTNLTKRVNNQTNCCIALEILKKIWICLIFI